MRFNWHNFILSARHLPKHHHHLLMDAMVEEHRALCVLNKLPVRLKWSLMQSNRKLANCTTLPPRHATYHLPPKVRVI